MDSFSVPFKTSIPHLPTSPSSPFSPCICNAGKCVINKHYVACLFPFISENHRVTITWRAVHLHPHEACGFSLVKAFHTQIESECETELNYPETIINLDCTLKYIQKGKIRIKFPKSKQTLRILSTISFRFVFRFYYGE